MKYFVSESGEYFAYEDDVEAPAGFTAVTEEDAVFATRLMTPAEQLAQAIADRRYIEETSGITINGVKIDTGRDSQALITGAALSAMLDSSYLCTWKTVSGPVQLSAAQLLAIAKAVRAHVQACFDREADLLAAVADGSITGEMLEEGWPT